VTGADGVESRFVEIRVDGTISRQTDTDDPSAMEMPMKAATKAFAAAFALSTILAPGLALAQGCDHGREAIKMTCAEGTGWDDKTAKCVPIVGS
jgi:hypothetical protein